ncbi:MAG: sulfurtransferase complex subunit TusC [Candidatus Symbiodolus clandestinus]
MRSIAVVMTQAPHGEALGREGLDAALAIAALCESSQLALFFMGDGVLQLLPGQQPSLILARDYSPTFKLLDLYEIKHSYVCQADLVDRGFETQQPLIIPVSYLTAEQFRQQLEQFTVLLTF